MELQSRNTFDALIQHQFVIYCADVWKEIEDITWELIEAFNDGTLDPADYYTEDCQLIRPGREAIHGHQGIGVKTCSTYRAP